MNPSQISFKQSSILEHWFKLETYRMNTLIFLLNELEAKIPFAETLNKNISEANVAWHIEHSLLVLDSATKFITESKPEDYKRSFNFTRIIIFTMKSFPRGKARAPKSVRPEAQISPSSLVSHISETRTKIKVLETLSPDQFTAHPYFGHLKLKQAIKFLGIHTNHHVKIIDDIIKK